MYSTGNYIADGIYDLPNDDDGSSLCPCCRESFNYELEPVKFDAKRNLMVIDEEGLQLCDDCCKDFESAFMYGNELINDSYLLHGKQRKEMFNEGYNVYKAYLDKYNNLINK